MRKRYLAVIMCLMLVLAIPAHAMSTRGIRVQPILSFSGTTATCKVNLKSGSTTDKVSATLILYQGSTEIDSWTSTGTGRVTISETCSVKKGKSYTLTLEYSINGVAQSDVSVNGTCR